MKHFARIALHQLELNISLGVSEAERSQPQTVWLDIDINFSEPPQACLTDQLKDTFCYDLLTQQIATQIVPRSFHLLEHLAHEIYQLIKSSFTQSLSVRVKVTKKPLLSAAFPIAGASFCYGDI
jgi:dihydroneopterin aldolase